MTRDKGFARGDLDPSFPIDDKFLALRKLVTTERYYSATGVYFHMAAATWREAERKPAAKVCPDATEIVADLVSVGLLDKDGRVPVRAYAHTVGRATKARRTTNERQARNRAEKSRVTSSDTGVTTEMSVLDGTVLNGSSSSSKEDARESLATLGWDATPQAPSLVPIPVLTVVPQPSVPPFMLVVDYLQMRTGRSYQFGPGSKVHECLSPDVRDFGAQAVIDAMAGLTKSPHPDIGELVFGASRALHPIASPDRKPDESQAIFDRGVERTRREMARMRGDA